MIGSWCTPFRTYFVDCSICICPANGRTDEAPCENNSPCKINRNPTFSDISLKKMSCLSNVIYLFPCLHCTCSSQGYFLKENCIDKCGLKSLNAKCKPNTFYRRQCNVCLCSFSGIADDKVCSKKVCSGQDQLSSLVQLQINYDFTSPYIFTPPRCIYCICGADKRLNTNACLEAECLSSIYEHYGTKINCTLGEIVPVCVECFPLKDSSLRPEYCTTSCSIKDKLNVLENVVKDNIDSKNLIEYNLLPKFVNISDSCNLSSVIIFEDSYCICFENRIDYKNCITLPIKLSQDENSFSVNENIINIDSSVSCEPSTFVEFDCNTCFCSKKGKIDLNWCTNDDCVAKRIIQNSQNTKDIQKNTKEKCVPGSISKVDCNFCICSSNGITSKQACTSNHCSGGRNQLSDGTQFTCEPLNYFIIDCNICLCPRDGIKNVVKCTKNLCENNFRRSDVCVPGELFTDECNVCICPPNGDKNDKVCTNDICPDAVLATKEIFNISQTIFGKSGEEIHKRTIEVCFRNEEFMMGCNLCICPEVGLRAFAICTPILCNDDVRSHFLF